jgi:hypothetical protein
VEIPCEAATIFQQSIDSMFHRFERAGNVVLSERLHIRAGKDFASLRGKTISRAAVIRVGPSVSKPFENPEPFLAFLHGISSFMKKNA